MILIVTHYANFWKLRTQSWDLINYLHNKLRTTFCSSCVIVYEDASNDCHNSSIFALLCKDPRGLAQVCQRSGYVVRAIVYPTVPLGKERIRICLHSGNSRKQIDGLLRVITDWEKTRSIMVTKNRL